MHELIINAKNIKMLYCPREHFINQPRKFIRSIPSRLRLLAMKWITDGSQHMLLEIHKHNGSVNFMYSGLQLGP